MPSSLTDVRVPPRTRSLYLIGGLLAAVAYSAYLAVKNIGMRAGANSGRIAPIASSPPDKSLYRPAKAASGQAPGQAPAQVPAEAEPPPWQAGQI